MRRETLRRGSVYARTLSTTSTASLASIRGWARAPEPPAIERLEEFSRPLLVVAAEHDDADNRWVAWGLDPGAGGLGEGKASPGEGRHVFGTVGYRRLAQSARPGGSVSRFRQATAVRVESSFAVERDRRRPGGGSL